jgi:hypothetical protein
MEQERIMHTYQVPLISHNLEDMAIPGVMVAVDPDEAESLGAFHETALSEADAWESNWDEGEDRYGE